MYYFFFFFKDCMLILSQQKKKGENKTIIKKETNCLRERKTKQKMEKGREGGKKFISLQIQTHTFTQQFCALFHCDVTKCTLYRAQSR